MTLTLSIRCKKGTMVVYTLIHQGKTIHSWIERSLKGLYLLVTCSWVMVWINGNSKNWWMIFWNIILTSGTLFSQIHQKLSKCLGNQSKKPEVYIKFLHHHLNSQFTLIIWVLGSRSGAKRNSIDSSIQSFSLNWKRRNWNRKWRRSSNGKKLKINRASGTSSARLRNDSRLETPD